MNPNAIADTTHCLALRFAHRDSVAAPRPSITGTGVLSKMSTSNSSDAHVLQPGLGPQDHAVGQHRGHDVLHIVRLDKIPAANRRHRLRRAIQRDRRPRAAAHPHVVMCRAWRGRSA